MFEDLVELAAVTSPSVLSLYDNARTPSCCSATQFLTITVDAVASLVAGQQPIDRKLTADMEHQCKPRVMFTHWCSSMLTLVAIDAI